VKVIATALNGLDWKVRKYGFPFVTEYPAVMGLESAGVVEEVGEGVNTFVKGDRVVHQGTLNNTNATFQQFTIVPAEIAAKIPSNITFEQAASVPVGLATAALGLYGDRAPGGPVKYAAPWDENGKGKYVGKPIVLFGGSSSIGQYVIQLAKQSGFSPIIVTASAHNAPHLKALGATDVLDRNADVVAEVEKITGGTPVEIVFDAISIKSTQEPAWEILAPGGLLILTLGAEVDKEKYKNKYIMESNGNVHLPFNRAFGKIMYRKLTQLLEDGSIQPNRIELVPNGLQGIVDGLRRIENNEVSGVKLIAHPQETA